MRTEWQKAYDKAYYKKHKKRLIARRRQRYLENREIELAKNKAWNKSHIEFKRVYDKEFARQLREKEAIKLIKKRRLERAYRKRRRELYQKRKVEGYFKSDAIRAYQKEYYKKNRDRITRYRRECYAKKKIKDSDGEVEFVSRITTRLRDDGTVRRQNTNV